MERVLAHEHQEQILSASLNAYIHHSHTSMHLMYSFQLPLKIQPLIHITPLIA